ncbi:MAG: signal peptidase I [Acidobacteria bacterium]|nr:signal peptidase I [Acidobacteriota bacterium]
MPDDSPHEPVSALDTNSEMEKAVPRRRKSRQRAFIEWLIILVVAVSVSMLVRTYVVQQFSIPSGSMIPTLDVGDRILVDKLSVELGTINRGDIVVFRHPPKALTTCAPPVEPIFIKRVIGLPGDVITSKGSTIYVNGKALKESWQTTSPFGPAIGHVVVPANHYFMMGDNRGESCDSRYWGTVPRSAIIGKAFLRIWPFNRIGFL